MVDCGREKREEKRVDRQHGDGYNTHILIQPNNHEKSCAIVMTHGGRRGEKQDEQQRESQTCVEPGIG